MTPACSAGSCPQPGPFWARCCRVERALPPPGCVWEHQRPEGISKPPGASLPGATPCPSLWYPRRPVTLGSPPAQGVQSSGCSRWGGGFGGRLFNWTPSLLTKGKSQEPRGGGWKARGFISHFSASQELLVVFPFNFMFLSCSGNLEKFGNHLSIFIREIFFSSEL